MKGRDVIKQIGADGWKLYATRGSHRQHKHPAKPGRVTYQGIRAMMSRKGQARQLEVPLPATTEWPSIRTSGSGSIKYVGL